MFDFIFILVSYLIKIFIKNFYTKKKNFKYQKFHKNFF